MKHSRSIYKSLISLLLIALASCSQEEWEQEKKDAHIEDTLTRADLIEYTINVETAGTLESLVEAGNYSDAQKLIITGNIAYEDVKYIKFDMPSVEVLDLSRAKYSATYIREHFLQINNSTSTIKEISLPRGVTSIEALAFYGCSSLTNITIPESVINIGDAAFSGCSSLTSITIPEGVKDLGDHVFYYCSSLTNITIPNGVKSIKESAFQGCSSLINITIPQGLTSIEKNAFYCCSSLISITIPESVTSIGDGSFTACTSLTNITIPKNVTSLGSSAFSVCSSLTSITIPDGVTSIGYETFRGCSSLISITLPEGVTSIGDYAFAECSSLTSIAIPQGVANIGGCAFGWCSSLTNITLPESLIKIGDEAFWACDSLTSITIPEGVECIGNQAFYFCTSLTNITLPESLTSIGGDAFYMCSSLQKVTCKSSCDINDLSNTSNLECWLIINRPDDKLPMYGPNWKNVVINGVAENVKLPYQKDEKLTIPDEVKSIKKISYTMIFYANTSSSSYGIWRTIALPFTPTSIISTEKGALSPFDSGVEGAKNFWLREWTTEGLKDVTQIEASHPYLIAMPYSEEYADKYNISGKVTFSAENIAIENFGDNTPLAAKGTNYTMYASFSYMDRTDGVYVLNNSNQFVNNYSSIYPYEAYLKANTSTLRSVISLGKGRIATRAGSEGKREPRINDM